MIPRFQQGRLVDLKDIARLGPLSRSVSVRHSKTGDTGAYETKAVEEMAFRLAYDAVRD